MQYACVNELDKWRKDHLKSVSVLKDLLDTAELKLNAPVQVSFLNLRAFLTDVEVRKMTLALYHASYIFWPGKVQNTDVSLLVSTLYLKCPVASFFCETMSFYHL